MRNAKIYELRDAIINECTRKILEVTLTEYKMERKKKKKTNKMIRTCVTGPYMHQLGKENRIIAHTARRTRDRPK